MTVHDRLRKPRRAGAVEHPERVIGRNLLEDERGSRSSLAQLLPGQRSADARTSVLRVEIREHDGVLDRRQLREQLLHDSGAVEVLAAVPVAVDREQHLRLDLGEAVDHAPGTEVG